MKKSSSDPVPSSCIYRAVDGGSQAERLMHVLVKLWVLDDALAAA